MNKYLLSSFLLVSMLLTACNTPSVPEGGEDGGGEEGGGEIIPPTPKEETYVDKTVNSYVGINDVKDFSLRFFETLPNVPYVELTSYMSRFYFKDLEETKENTTYTYTYNEDYIVLDTKNDVLTISSIKNFAYITEHFIDTYYVSKFDETESTIIKKDRVFNLALYHIDIKECEDTAYIPLSTISDILQYVEGCSVAYNEKDVYFIDGFMQLGINAYYSDYPDYLSVITSNEERKEDLIEFSYNELCFSIDKVNGHPSSMAIGRDRLEQYGLDGALTQFFPEVKEYLLSNDRYQYYQGYYYLFGELLFDGGHTTPIGYGFALDEDKINELYVKNNEFQAVVDRAYVKFYEEQISYNQFAQARYYGIGEYNYYRKIVDGVGYVAFSSFYLLTDIWNKYYKGVGELPNDDDPFIFVKGALDYFKENGVKNVVFDVSTNGGGDPRVLNALASMMLKKDTYFRYYDTTVGEVNEEKWKLDYNFDGVSNEEDYNLIDYDFNYAILTSHFSFSCANAFPLYMKDEGVMIIGEQSGGGSCCVSMMVTAEGVPYRGSAIARLVNKDNIEFDSGVPVDHELTAEQSFNGSIVNDVMNQFYGAID